MEQDGRGPAVVFAHGGTGDLRMWDDQVTALGAVLAGCDVVLAGDGAEFAGSGRVTADLNCLQLTTRDEQVSPDLSAGEQLTCTRTDLFAP